MDSYRAIENLIYTYAELIDAGELAALAELFSHAEFIGPDGEVASRGAGEFLTLMDKAVRIYAETGTPRTSHVTTNLIIEVDEAADSASARSYFTVLQATDELPLQPIIAGRYRDTFTRVENCWRFSARQSIPELFGDLSQHLL